MTANPGKTINSGFTVSIDETVCNPHLRAMSETQFSVSESAARRIAVLAAKEAKPVMMRVAVLGGG